MSKNKYSCYKIKRKNHTLILAIKISGIIYKKNIDYGDTFAKYGLIGVLIRIEDKIQRSLSITKN